MAKLLPKKVLDEELLKHLIEYYKIDTSSESWNSEVLLEWECFSHPSLELHDCNTRARLLGGQLCEHCKHVVGRPCRISCDLQHFCLAVFAWRLGIGGDDLEKALKHNLYKLKNEELYKEVIKVFSLEGIEEVQEEVIEKTPNIGQNKEIIMSEVPTIETTDVAETEDLLTVKQAAEIYGCSYANIYNYVKAGKLPRVLVGSKSRIRRSDLDEFRNRPRRSRRTNTLTTKG